MTNCSDNISFRTFRTLCALAISLFFMVSVNSCSGKEEKQADSEVDYSYRYDHIDRIVSQYTDLLLSTPPEGMEMEKLLMDINSRSEMLRAAGDTLTALYFRHSIEHTLRTLDNNLADRIFGPTPYSAFNL